MITPAAKSDIDLSFSRAIDIVGALRDGIVSRVELLERTYAQIAASNPAVNAICTLVPIEHVRKQAERYDAIQQRGESLPVLAGIPMAIKDLAETKDIRTTRGSPLFKDYLPEYDCLMVERLKAAGVIVIGKTNTPEFGAGSHTFNALFGATANPYKLSLSAGGSSGGAAAALASGMVCLADGSDLGGSLRNPAAFCNVVGLRPTLGRVPSWPQKSSRFARMAVEGPMARTVEDCALLLQVMAGADSRDPRSLMPPLQANSLFDKPIGAEQPRIGLSTRPAGLPVEKSIITAIEKAAQSLVSLGAKVDPIELDEMRGAMAVFEILRASALAMIAGELLEAHPTLMKPTLAGNIRQGIELSSADIYQAEMERTRISADIDRLFTQYDYFITPTTQVMPFPLALEYPQEIEGQAMANYLEWMSSCCIWSPFDLPCLSLPAGFDNQGVPIGMQIIGRPGDDVGVLRMAYAIQETAPYWQRKPLLEKSTSI